MTEIKIYEINADYVDYLAPFAPHLFRNSKKGQANTRKYIGIVLHINGYDYFAPLSSFKPKHEKNERGTGLPKGQGLCGYQSEQYVSGAAVRMCLCGF